MTTTDPVQAAILAAQTAAGQFVQQQAAPVPAVPVPSAAPVAPVAVTPGVPVSLDDLMVGSMAVDAWLKVSEFGITIGKDKTIFQTLDVLLDMTEVQGGFAIKAGQNPAKYWRSYDKVTCVTGGTWAEACATAQRIDPKAREYRTADLPFTVIEDIKNAKGEVLVASGNRLGHSLSTTGWKNFELFYRDLVRNGLSRSVLKIQLGFEAKSGNGNEWGVFTYTNLGAVNAAE